MEPLDKPKTGPRDDVKDFDLRKIVDDSIDWFNRYGSQLLPVYGAGEITYSLFKGKQTIIQSFGDPRHAREDQNHPWKTYAVVAWHAVTTTAVLTGLAGLAYGLHTAMNNVTHF